MHVVLDTALIDDDHVPAGHDRHTVSPSPGAKWPAGHAAQPAAPRPEMVPSRQGRHVADVTAPMVGENQPAAHLVQAVEPARAHEPARHVEHDALASAEKFPAAHGVHVADETAPLAAE